MSRISVKVPKRNTEPIEFDLEDGAPKAHVYVFTPPKQADMVLPMLGAENDLEAARAAFEWLDEGMSEEDRDRVAARLKDPNDDLDIDTIQEVVTLLVEAAGGNPTT